MRHRISGASPHLLALLLLALLALPSPPLVAATEQRCFPETGFCIGGRLRTFWEQQGGLAVFGYPVSAPRDEVNREDGRSYRTQWFERVRLEEHPEHAPPYDVLLGRIGVERLQLDGVSWQNLPQAAGPQPGCRWFAETRHNVCDQAAGNGFLQFWQGHGLLDPALDADGRSLALFGLPLSEATVEVSPTDGRPYLTQWFERARFEWHPEQSDPQYAVLLGLLGNEVRSAPQPVGGNSAGFLVAGGELAVWSEYGPGDRFDLYVYNRVTGTRTLVESAPGAQTGLATDGRLVVWAEAPPGAQARLRLYDTATGELRPLLTGQAGDDGFGSTAVADGVVYVERSSSGQRGLFALDLASGALEQITPTGSNPVAAEGLLLWTETSTHGADPAFRATHRLILRTLDGSRPDTEIARLDDQSGFSRYAIAGGTVVYGGYRQRIAVYDPQSGETTTVADDGFRPIWLGGQVLWAIPPAQGPWAIRAWDPATGTTTTVRSEAGLGWDFVGLGTSTVLYVRNGPQASRAVYRYDWPR